MTQNAIVYLTALIGIVGALLLKDSTTITATVNAILVSEGVLISLIPVLISSILGVNKQTNLDIIEPRLAKQFFNGMISLELTLIVSFILIVVYTLYSTFSSETWFILGLGLGLLFASLSLFAVLLYELRWRDNVRDKRS